MNKAKYIKHKKKMEPDWHQAYRGGKTDLYKKRLTTRTTSKRLEDAQKIPLLWQKPSPEKKRAEGGGLQPRKRKTSFF